MSFAKCILLFLGSCICFFGKTQTLYPHTTVLKLMGSRFEVVALSSSPDTARRAVQACIQEIQRIERLISSWDQNSETSQINQYAGIRPVRVSRELFELIRRSIKISSLTQGAFDISYASMDRIWQFDGSMQTMPSEEQISASVRNVNYQNILLDAGQHTVFLKEKGMKIGFGAIGKGYAANRGRKMMQQLGIQNGMVNAGGDLIAWGTQEDRQPWKIGIVNPHNKNKVFSWLHIQEQAVVTSGNYERYVWLNGERYTHIIDPRTGYPVKGIQSVTIVCPDAELADALATAVFVLGTEAGLYLVNQLKGVECLIIQEDNTMKASQNLQLTPAKE